MKKLFVSWCMVLLSTIYSFSQRQADVWQFGAGAGLDFSTCPPTATDNFNQPYFTTSFSSSASIANPLTGELFFHTNGEKVFNRKYQIMPNGDSLLGSTDASQGVIINPVPKSTNLYYIFYLSKKLYFSIVDMNLDGGLGDLHL